MKMYMNMGILGKKEKKRKKIFESRMLAKTRISLFQREKFSHNGSLEFTCLPETH